MLVLVILTSLFWSFLNWSPKNGWFRLKRFVLHSALNILLGWLAYRLLALGLHWKGIMLLTGFVILISGFRWLEILNQDFFSLFQRLPFLNLSRMSERYSVYFSGLAALAQLSTAGIDLKPVFWIIFMNIFLAGFLLLFSIRSAWLIRHKPIVSLMRVEAGLYLTIMGLIVMSGDVPFFVMGIEKILHI